MRILRSQSNIEVSYKGFAWFVVGLILATFLGGAIRTILSSDRVQARITSELKNRFPRHEFNIGHTEVLLSRGLWPGLALRLTDVVFKQDVCGKLSFVLDVPQMVLPVDLWRLLQGQPRLGIVDIESGSARLDYRDCSAKPLSEPGLPAGASINGIRTAMAEKGIRPLNVNWPRLAQVLHGLRLRDFTVTYERNLTWQLFFKRADIHVADDMQMQAAVDVRKSLPSGTLSHPVSMEAHGDQKDFEWTVLAEFNEGRLNWHGKWDQEANSAEAEFEMLQIPVRDVTSEMFQMGFMEREINLKTAWLTCSANWQGNLSRWAVSPVRLRACKLEGAYGRADLEQADVYAGAEPPLKEAAQVRVQKLQLLPLVESLGRQVLPAVMGKLGVWTGSIAFAGPNSWQLDGLLEGAEVIFSNQSVRGKQVLRSMHTQARREGATTEVRVDNILLQDGESKGDVLFHLSDDWRSGDFEAHFESFSLNPNLQRLFLGGALAPVQFSGQGTLRRGELENWSGEFQSAQLLGEGWRVEDLNIKSRFIEGTMHLDAKAARAAVEPRWHYFRQLENLNQPLKDAVHWRELTARLEIDRSGGNLSQLSATRSEPMQAWKASGGWRRDGDFKGRLQLEAGDQHQRFHIRGSRGSLAVLADSDRG